MSSDEKQNLERVLESAIVVSWADLTRDAQPALFQIEYAFAPTGTLDYLKVWSSLSRGHWLLACEYWMSESAFHGAGAHFENGYASESLAHILELVMRHQGEFDLPANLGRQGLLQISTPTPEDRAIADELVHAVFDRLGSASPEPAMA